MCKIFFLTFCNSGYYTTNIIAKQAESFNLFDNILQFNENNIVEFITKHRKFINNNKYGYGMWIWKPKIIFDVLNGMQDNDILLYCDAGFFLNVEGKERFLDYLKLLDKHDIITFSAGDKYKAKHYVKNDAIMNYYPDMHNYDDNVVYAGLMIIKKNMKSTLLIKEWLELCENYHYLDRSPSIQYTDKSYYIGNDCDNGLFNLCLSKFKIDYKINHDEVNIFTKDGLQVQHSNIKITNDDWKILNKYPFQNRRLNKNDYK